MRPAGSVSLEQGVLPVEGFFGLTEEGTTTWCTIKASIMLPWLSS